MFIRYSKFLALLLSSGKNTAANISMSLLIKRDFSSDAVLLIQSDTALWGWTTAAELVYSGAWKKNTYVGSYETNF